MKTVEKEKPFRFRMYAWRQFKKNKPALVALYVLAFLALIALLAPILANDRPLCMKYRGHVFFPAFSLKKTIEVKTEAGIEKISLDVADWKKMNLDEVIWAPIPYSPGKSDYLNSGFVSPGGDQRFFQSGAELKMPLRFQHWLGTGARGNDLLSGLIHGTRISLTIGFLSMGIATLIGILIGSLAGFLGDDRLVSTRGRFLFTLFGIFIGWFYAFQVRHHYLEEAWHERGFIGQLLISILLFLFILFLFSQAGKLTGKIPWLDKIIHVPVDSLFSRMIEIFVSLPILLLIFILAAISQPSIVNVMILIGLTNWTGIARLTRAEMLRIRRLEYIQSGEALGFSPLRIIWKHSLPNALAPALIVVSFGIADAILIESSLSFIGIGVPSDIITWGSLINSGRENFNAWWMVIFPGICILITVLCYNLIGEGLRDALEPKLKK